MKTMGQTRSSPGQTRSIFRLCRRISITTERVLEQAFRDGAKALILCNPSNPCGKVFTMGEMEEIAELAKRYDAFVITDEVYEYIIYDGNRHISMAALPGMYERTITCSSLSKTYSMTGWRLGYLIGPERVIEAAKKVHDFPHGGRCGTSSGSSSHRLKIWTGVL